MESGFAGILTLVLGGLLAAAAALFHRHRRGLPRRSVPVSVNYHFTRKCNAQCGFCFHTEKTSHVASLEEAKRGLALLKRAGMRKVNFAGGEPFLYRKFLGRLCRYCKDELGLESVSIVSNGSKIDRDWLGRYGGSVDILAVSCDSFDPATNVAIGRTDNGRDYGNVERLFRIAGWCREYGIRFKLNSVVCALNHAEDMAGTVAELAPFRWKVFQVLMIAGENDSSETKRDARRFRITDEQFEAFCDRHSHLDCFVPEPNRLMKNSYLILDEYLRFLDKDNQFTSRSILEVGVERALRTVEWDEENFRERGGLYDWTKEGGGEGCASGALAEDAKGLEW